MKITSPLYRTSTIRKWDCSPLHSSTDRNAVFECYFRDMPFENGYAIFAGLERLIDYLNDLSFSETDIAYLREIGGYPEAFLEYLKEFKFACRNRGRHRRQ